MPETDADRTSSEEPAQEGQATDALKERLLREQTLWNEGNLKPKHAGGAPLGAIQGHVKHRQTKIDVDDVKGRPPGADDTQYQGA